MEYVLLSYLVARPFLTIATEGIRAGMMLTWSPKALVQVHLGSLGHQGGPSIRTGRVVWRIHPYLLLMRGSISDTPAQPNGWQFAAWCAAGILLPLLILAVLVPVILLTGEPPDALLIAFAMLGFLSLLDAGFAIVRELQPVLMQCGMAYMGPFATLRLLWRHRKRGRDYLMGLRAYLRDDYGAALRHWEGMGSSPDATEELLEDIAYAQFVTGHHRASLATFQHLEQNVAVPNATQLSVAALAHWKAGEPEAAFNMIHRAVANTPGHAMALNAHAWMAIQAGRPAQALPSLLTATRNAPEYATAWANLSHCHRQLGDLNASEAAARTAFQHDPTDLNVLEALSAIAETRQPGSGAQWQDRIRTMKSGGPEST